MSLDSGSRVVIDAAELWLPRDERAASLKAQNRRSLGTRRVFAAVVDRVALLLPTGVALALFGVGGWLVATAVILAYFFVWESLNGQTLGKWMLGLRVVRVDGGPLNIAAVATRNVLLLVDQTVGIFFIVATRRRQRLGDLLAGTMITAAADHRHVPGGERFRGAMVAAYPVAWIGAAVVMASFTNAGVARQRYLDLANATCVNARQAVLSNPDAGLAELHASTADVERTLRVLDAPAGMRAAQARLVAAVHRERALLGRAVRARRSELPALAASYRAMVARDARQARADGYVGCA